jgi:hypothetical protein
MAHPAVVSANVVMTSISRQLMTLGVSPLLPEWQQKPDVSGMTFFEPLKV